MIIVFYTAVTRKITGNTIFEEPLGGTHSAMVNLARALSQFGHQVTVFTNCGNEEGLYNGVNYLEKNKIIKYAKENAIDVFIPVASESALKLKIKAAKTVLWLHNDYSLYWKNELPDIASRLSEYFAVKADKLVVCSNWQKQAIKETFKIPDTHICVIRNGVNLELFKEKPASKSNRLIYSSVPDRGLDLLLKFFPDIRTILPEAELHVYSSFKTWGNPDPVIKELETEIKQPMEKVFFHEPVPAARLALKLAESKLWLYPNHASPATHFFAETFCISALEAQAAGLPVISGRRGALPELVTDNNNGFLINHDPYSEEYQEEFIQKTGQLLKDEQLYKTFSQNAVINAQKYSWQLIAREWEHFFEALLSEKESTRLTAAPLEAKFPPPSVSVIIPAYNRASNLAYCLNSLTWQTFKNFEVIIADDGSTDNTSEVTDRFRDRFSLRYVYGGENKGFRAARIRNIGLSKARGELIIFLDSDLVVPPGFIEEHIRAHQKFDRILVNSYVYRMKEKLETDLGMPPAEYILKHRENLKEDSRDKYNLFERPGPVEEGYFLDSNSLSVKASHIIQEGFDPDFTGWGLEDTELGYRFITKGFKFLFIKENCTAYHIFHGIQPGLEEQKKVNWERLRKKYRLKKWYVPLHAITVSGNIFTENQTALPGKFELKTGDFIKFPPAVVLKLENGVIKEIGFN